MNVRLNVDREVKLRGRAQIPTLRSGCGKRRVLGKMLDREVNEAGENNNESFGEAQQGKFTSLKCVECFRKESRMIS